MRPGGHRVGRSTDMARAMVWLAAAVGLFFAGVIGIVEFTHQYSPTLVNITVVISFIIIAGVSIAICLDKAAR